VPITGIDRPPGRRAANEGRVAQQKNRPSPGAATSGFRFFGQSFLSFRPELPDGRISSDSSVGIEDVSLLSPGSSVDSDKTPKADGEFHRQQSCR